MSFAPLEPAVVADAVPRIASLIRELAEEGIAPSSDMGESVIRLWLAAPTAERCNCGAPLARYEHLNGKCWRCAHDQILRVADAFAERRRFAK